MERNKKIKIAVICTLVAVVGAITLAYAANKLRVNITGGAEYNSDTYMDFAIDKNDIKVEETGEGKADVSNVEFNEDDLSLTGLAVTLKNPGSKVRFIIPIKNTGNLPARFSDIEFGTEGGSSFTCKDENGNADKVIDAFCSDLNIRIVYNGKNVVTNNNGNIIYNPDYTNTINHTFYKIDDPETKITSGTVAFFNDTLVSTSSSNKIKKAGNALIIKPDETDEIIIEYEYNYDYYEEQIKPNTIIKVSGLILNVVLSSANV